MVAHWQGTVREMPVSLYTCCGAVDQFRVKHNYDVVQLVTASSSR